MRVFDNLDQLDAAMLREVGQPGAFRFLAEYMPAGFKCGRCGKVVPFPVSEQSCGTGYARTPDYPTGMVCYACCGEIDREYMLANDKIGLYLVKRDGKHEVVNWPGTLRFAAVIVGREATITGPDGKTWRGTVPLKDTQYINMRRGK